MAYKEKPAPDELVDADTQTMHGRRKVKFKRMARQKPFNSLVKQLESPDSILQKFPEDMKNAALHIPESFLNIDEEEFRSKAKHELKWEPSQVAEALRSRFWLEMDRIEITKDEVLNMSNIYVGVCTNEYFVDKVLRNSAWWVFAWMLVRPVQYEANMHALLNLATRRLTDILSMPIRKDDGTYHDSKHIELVLKAAAMVDLRVKGGYIQRSETKNLTVQQNTVSYTNVLNGSGLMKKPIEQMSVEEIDQKLREVEEEMGKTRELPSPPPVEFSVKSNPIEREVIEVKSHVVEKSDEQF